MGSFPEQRLVTEPNFDRAQRIFAWPEFESFSALVQESYAALFKSNDLFVKTRMNNGSNDNRK